MATFSLSDTAKSYFNHELISKAGIALGESESGISKAVSAIIPAIIGSLADKASTSDGAMKVARLADEQHRAGILETIAGFLHHDTNSNLISKSSLIISSLFGNGGQSNLLTNLVSNYAGIKSSSAGTLFSMALPVILGLIGRHSEEHDLNAAGFGSFLSSQKAAAVQTLPAGFDASAFTAGASAQAAAHHHEEETHKPAGPWGWIIPLIVLALIAIGCYYAFKNSTAKHEEHEGTAAEAHEGTEGNGSTIVVWAKGKVDSLSGDFMYNEGDTITITLPNNGGELRVGKYSTEARLTEFLNNKDAVIDTVKGNWFEFTNVHFKTGSSVLTDLSAAQLKNLVAIAKAYPAAKFKFGGYTDNTGTAEVNLQLSQKRADAVSAMTAKFGAPAASIDGAKGYGQEWPVESNETAEGRAMNRRVAVNVKAK